MDLETLNAFSRLRQIDPIIRTIDDSLHTDRHGVQYIDFRVAYASCKRNEVPGRPDLIEKPLGINQILKDLITVLTAD